MKENVETFPTCEKCPIFLKADQARYDTRALQCEGIRACGKCPKDVWKDAFTIELGQILQKTKSYKALTEKGRFAQELLIHAIERIIGVEHV